jgi:hypothetical protein
MSVYLELMPPFIKRFFLLQRSRKWTWNRLYQARERMPTLGKPVCSALWARYPLLLDEAAHAVAAVKIQLAHTNCV